MLDPEGLGEIVRADDTPHGELIYPFGGKTLFLKRAARAGAALGYALDDVWQETMLDGKKFLAESFSRSAAV